jgi:hypothetical protein
VGLGLSEDKYTTETIALFPEMKYSRIIGTTVGNIT